MGGYGQRSGRLLRWLVVGPAALAGLFAVVVGGPVLLLWFGGNPLPQQWLSPGELMDLLTRPDDGQLLVWALTVVGWGAWAVVTGSLLLELAAQLTGRRTLQVPGLAGPQRLASLLVAGVLAALTAPGVSHAAQAAYFDSPAPVTSPAPPLAVTGLPAQPDQPAPVEAEPTRAELAGEELVHEVARGDWMWHIAGRYLGDETRYPEIAALNPEYAQQYANYPDHIQPGDQLVLPADADDRGERRHATGEPTGESAAPSDEAAPPTEPPPAAPTNPPVDPTTDPATPAPVPSTPTGPATPASPPPPLELSPPSPPPASAAVPPAAVPPGLGPSASAPGSGPPPASTPPPAADPAPPAAAGVEDEDGGAPLLGSAVTSGMLAAVLLGALVFYRWRKSARRGHRRMVSAAAGAPAEAGLRGAATADVARLDQALRVLAAGLAAEVARARTAGQPLPPLPDVGAVWIGEGEIHLILAGPCELVPPEPFGVSGPGSWFLPADAPLPSAEGTVAPLPGLVTIGSQPGQHLLVDLERMGMLTICGPPERTSDLLRYLVAELAHNPWSDRVEVTLAGFAPELAEALAALRPARVSVAESVPAAVHQLRRRLAHTTEALAAHGLTDSVQGRLTDTATDTWAPQLLLIDHPGAEHDELLAYLEESMSDAGRRCAVAVVSTAPASAPYGRRSITITSDGLLKAGFLHDAHTLPAVGLPVHLLGPLAELLRDAEAGADHPIPPASEPWAAGADATGGYPVPAVAEPPPAVASPAEVAESAPASRPSPIINPRLGSVETDPELDQAVAHWWQEEEYQPPRVSLLGPVQLVAPGAPPVHRMRVCQELIVYLAAVGERGADAAEIAGALWPYQQVRPTVRTDVIMSVRRWLGGSPQGEPWLSEATPDGRYRLNPGVLVDWHLFRRLRARGERRAAAGVEDLRAALRLVRGAPLADAGELASASVRVPYSWLPGSPVAPELVLAGVVDTAHQLVELSLASGDLETARWAVGQAWLADPRRSDDHPWRDLLRIRQMERDEPGIRVVVAELLQWRDAEHPDELSTDTRELIRSLPPFQPANSGGPR